MVFHLPNEPDMRLNHTYTQLFALTLLWNIGLAGMLAVGIFIFTLIIKQYNLRARKNQLLRDSMITTEERMSATNITKNVESETLNEKQKKINPQTISFKIINLVTSFFFYIVLMIVSLIYWTFYSFGFYGRGTYIDVLSVFAMTMIVVIPTLIWKYKTKVRSLSSNRGQVAATVILLVLWLGVCVMLVIVGKGSCVCYYNEYYGFKVEADSSLSTDFLRLMKLQKVCPDDKVCHFYATLPQDTSRQVFFNAHTGTNVQNITFKLLNQNNQTIKSINNSVPILMDNVESIGQRNIYSVLFDNLTPNTTYIVQIINKNGIILKNTTYKTLPNYDSDLKIISGGDLGMTKDGIKMTQYINDFEPDVILLGGDTVYDDGMRTCYYSWDNFYWMFEDMFAKKNRIIPLVMSIGNHDVGFDALTVGSVQRSLQNIPLFFLYNPQHKNSNGTQIPLPEDRLPYHYHVIGKTIHFHLDSGYLTSYLQQTYFITSVIAKFQKKYYYFANYHNPIYPSCTDITPNSNDRKVIQNGMKYWTPLFDKYQFITVMEHHTHYRKMTYRLTNNTNSTGLGPRYIGDGSWGVREMTCKDTNQPENINLIQNYTTKNPNHIWKITLQFNKTADQKTNITYIAIDLNNHIVTSQKDSIDSI